MMAEAAQITGLGKDRQGIDRSDAWDHPQKLIIAVRGQRVMGDPLNLIALLDQGTSLSDDHAEHRR